MGGWDRVRPKRCATCGRWYFSGGKKTIVGDMRHPKVAIHYTCDRC
jgi:hypothetical protein